MELQPSNAEVGVRLRVVPHGLARLGCGLDAQARAHGVGGMQWTATAALALDVWVSGLPKGAGKALAPLQAVLDGATRRRHA